MSINRRRVRGPNLNGLIKANTVRVVGPDGEAIGVFSIGDALRKASELNLDLVEISPESDPPVCKILDYGKYKYNKQKKQNQTKKKQKTMVIKEIKLRPNIGDHDYQVKLKRAIEFVIEGARVKVSLRFRGREITHKEVGLKIVERMIEEMSDIATLDGKINQDGPQIVILLVPKSNV